MVNVQTRSVGRVAGMIYNCKKHAAETTFPIYRHVESITAGGNRVI